MKKVLLSFVFWTTFFVFSQKSIQFADPQPSGLPFQTTVQSNYFGTYKSTQTQAKYVIDENGISIVTVLISFVTREQVRESSKLLVRGDYLLGIKPNDSVPCTLEGEKYYYGIESKLVIIGAGSLNKLVKLSSNRYVINFHEGLYFEPSILVFDVQGFSITHPSLAFQPAFDALLKVNTVTRYGSEVVVVAPTYEQWEGLEKALFGEEKWVYKKE